MSRNRVAAHRARLREAGMRPVQFLVPDARQGGVYTDMARQAATVAASRSAKEVLTQFEGIRCIAVAPWVIACLPSTT
jgi:hypothetical protein